MILVGKREEKRQFSLEELSVDGKKIKLILNKNGGKRWIRLIWLSIGTTGGALVNMVMKRRAP
jgi:hypothetical protein